VKYSLSEALASGSRSLYGAAEFRDSVVNRSAAHLSLQKLLTIGLILSACALGGCGRKGPLDLPPGSAAVPNAPAVTSEQSGDQNYRSNSADPNLFGGPATDQQQVSAPRGVKKRIPLDAILD
jgi:predicted small lipoprotein YifL